MGKYLKVNLPEAEGTSVFGVDGNYLVQMLSWILFGHLESG